MTRRAPLAASAAIAIFVASSAPVSSQGTFTAPRFASPTMMPGSVSCSDLTALRETDLRIESARLIEPDPTWAIPHPRPQDPSLDLSVPFCRVQGIVEREIFFELWLPMREDWNGRMLGTGNGGFAGFLRYDGLAHGLLRGFASVSTNTGHWHDQRHWPVGYPDRLENYGHRGQHLVAVKAKRLISAFYGDNPDYSYFMGCSGGGMQAMNEVQRYPQDYDGILAGAHGHSIAGISARWLESALIGNGWDGERLALEQWGDISRAAVRQCDAADGVTDGVINDPRSCSFAISDTPGLTAGQVHTAQRLLGPIRGEDGSILFEAYQPGPVFPALDDPGRAGEVFAEWLHQDPSWDPTSFIAARDLPLSEHAATGSAFRNPNLASFAARGGKLISYHGWDDGIVPGEATIRYYDSVRRFMGGEATDDFYRLYMVPGMDHCSGGAGADAFGQTFLLDIQREPTAQNDVLLALMRWVEHGEAPANMTAAKLDNDAVTYTRPLCPYPQVPHYDGHGDPDDATSFTCRQP